MNQESTIWHLVVNTLAGVARITVSDIDEDRTYAIADPGEHIESSHETKEDAVKAHAAWTAAATATTDHVTPCRDEQRHKAVQGALEKVILKALDVGEYECIGDIANILLLHFPAHH